jgi:hypothetical protein
MTKEEGDPPNEAGTSENNGDGPRFEGQTIFKGDFDSSDDEEK